MYFEPRFPGNTNVHSFCVIRKLYKAALILLSEHSIWEACTPCDFFCDSFFFPAGGHQVMFWSLEAQKSSAENIWQYGSLLPVPGYVAKTCHCPTVLWGTKDALSWFLHKGLFVKQKKHTLLLLCFWSSRLLMDRCECAVPTQVPSSLTTPTTATKEAVTESYAASWDEWRLGHLSHESLSCKSGWT